MTAPGFKVSAYLDDSLRRSLLRLAHAHGVILALVPAGSALSAIRASETCWSPWARGRCLPRPVRSPVCVSAAARPAPRATR
jgi:hypothetical protein